MMTCVLKRFLQAILVALGFFSLGLLSGCGGVSSGSQQESLTIITTSLPSGTVGTPYMQTIQATGGVGPFGWTVSVGALPHNLTLNSSVTNSVSISGMPDVQQTAVTFTIKVTDSANQSASQPYTVTIGASAPISVSVSPTSPSVVVNSTQQFMATVQNDPANKGVTWALAQGAASCSPGCGALSATSSASGTPITYTAPSTVPANPAVTLTATSVTDNTKSAVATVSVTNVPSISVEILPTSALIQVNGTVHFRADARNGPAIVGVTLSISGCTGGATVCGTLANVNNSGPFTTADYVAPATVPPGGKLSVTATSVTDNTKSASATVTINPITFASQNYPAGNTPRAVAVADFNGDGKLDIAVADYGNPSTGDNGGVSILLGNGDGTFQPAKLINAGKNPISIAIGDFNNDGKQDLVVTDFGDRSTGGKGSASLLLGNGDGTFQAPITLSAGNEPFALVAGDFNGDGKLDFAVSDFGSGVYVSLGNGNGTFQPPALFSTGNHPSAIAARDFNGDGKLDLAVAGLQTDFNSTVSILLGNGDGTFAPPVPYGINEYVPTSIATGDLSGNGKTDLAITTYNCIFGLCRAPIETLAGNGDGTFQASQVPPLTIPNPVFLFPPGLSLSLQVADFNGDGKVDLVEITGPYAAVFPGNGDGSFEGTLFFSGDQDPFALAIGDFNGDGKPDIVVANVTSNDITILLNATRP